MKKFYSFLLALVAISVQATNFVPNNLVVTVVGDGTTEYTQASAVEPIVPSVTGEVSLREYSPDTLLGVQAAAIQSIPVNPSILTFTVLTAVNSEADGNLSLSANGKYLSFVGYSAAANTDVTTITQANDRVIGRVDYTGAVDLSTAFAPLEDVTTFRNYRQAISNDGTGFWVTNANNSVYYVPFGGFEATPLTKFSNYSRLFIANNQLFGSNNYDSKLYYIPSLPTTEVVEAPLSTTLSGGNMQRNFGIVLLDSDPSVSWNGTGLDVLYACGTGGTGQGVHKFYWDATTSTWIFVTRIYDQAITSMTARMENGKPVIYAVTGNSQTTLNITRDDQKPLNNALIQIIDKNGLTGGGHGTFTIGNATINSTGGQTTAKLLAQAGANYGFRGVAFAPTQAGISAVNDVNINDFNAFATKGGLTIKSAEKHSYRILNTLGQVISKGIIETDNQFVPLNNKGIVIVQVNKQAAKVFLGN